MDLLRTATWLFSERGFHGTSIRDIADASEVSVSSMYYYASSKEEVLEVVMGRGMDCLVDSSREVLDRGAPPSERLATLIAVHVAMHARNPRTTRVIDHELRSLPPKTRKEMLARRDAYEAIWSDALRDGVEQGEFVDRGSVTRLAILQMCTGVAQWYKPRGELSIGELCDRFGDLGLAMVGANRDGRALTVADLEIPSVDDILALVELSTEPRRKPPGV